MSTENLHHGLKVEGGLLPSPREGISTAKKITHLREKIFAAIAVLCGGISLLYAQNKNPEFVQRSAYRIARVCGGPSETTAVSKATRSIIDDLSQDLEYEAHAETLALVEDEEGDGTEQERAIKMVIRQKNGKILLDAGYFVSHYKGKKLPTGFGGSNPPMNTLDADINMQLQRAINEYLNNNPNETKHNLVETIYLCGKWNDDPEKIRSGLEDDLEEIARKLLSKITDELRNNTGPSAEQLTDL